jgi:putative ABC transport system permease protein
MQTLWICLAEKSILTEPNIRSMKQYIAHKFPTYSSTRRASILANSVHRHLNAYLPPIDDLLKEQLRFLLLQTAYKQESFRIVSLDVFRACWQLTKERQEILEPLVSWLQLQSENVTSEQIADFIQTIEEELGWRDPNQIYPLYQEAIHPPVYVHGFQRFIKDFLLNNNVAGILLALLLSISFGTSHLLASEWSKVSNRSIQASFVMDSMITQASIQRIFPYSVDDVLKQADLNVALQELTDRYMFTPVAIGPLRQWLKQRDSLLAEEPYLSTILQTAEHYNIHPLLLLAIAGQEQALVPNSNSKASQIANNPFNVHHSWKEYNTDIADSSRIAAETILTLVKGRPQDINPLKWINRKYAEDTQWHVGVEGFFQKMLLQVNSSSFKADS